MPYRGVILRRPLILFGKERMVERPNAVVQKDRAPPHASKWQEMAADVFDAAGVARLLWLGENNFSLGTQS